MTARDLAAPAAPDPLGTSAKSIHTAAASCVMTAPAEYFKTGTEVLSITFRLPYGVSVQHAQAMAARMLRAAADDGTPHG